MSDEDRFLIMADYSLSQGRKKYLTDNGELTGDLKDACVWKTREEADKARFRAVVRMGLDSHALFVTAIIGLYESN